VTGSSIDCCPDAVFLLDAGSVPAGTLDDVPPTAWVVVTDGPRSLELLRDEIGGAALLDERGFAEIIGSDDLSFSYVPAPVGLIVKVGLAITLFVAVASLLVSTIGGVLERRTSLAALAAVGTPVGTLRSSLMVQTMAPLIAGTAIALGAAWAIAASWAPDLEVDWLVAVRATWWIGVGSVGLGVLTSLLVLPSFGRALRPEALHHE
jgi:FtsX-like permease family protein